VTTVEQWIAATPDLSADREQHSPERHSPNDFYGHAATIKSFAGLAPRSSLGLYIQHGVRFDLGYWQHDFNPAHRVGFVPSEWRVEVLMPQLDIRLFAIGPYIHYARPIWSAAEIERERAKLGRTLLVFPTHSTHWIDMDYDVDAFIERVRAVASGFDSVLVCLYWKDVLRGVGKRYSERGLPCITAGHIFDPLFLPRLRTAIELSDATFSNELGTQLGYSVCLGRPHQLLRSEVKRSTGVERMLKESTADTRQDQERFTAEFAAPPSAITPGQMELVRKFWGVGSERTAGELRVICRDAEQRRRTYLFTTLLPRRVRAAIASLSRRLRIGGKA